MQLITREALNATLDANDDSKLVMAVGPWEFRTKHIPGSLSFPSPRTALNALGELHGDCPHCDNGWSGYGWPPAA